MADYVDLRPFRVRPGVGGGSLSWEIFYNGEHFAYTRTLSDALGEVYAARALHQGHALTLPETAHETRESLTAGFGIKVDSAQLDDALAKLREVERVGGVVDAQLRRIAAMLIEAGNKIRGE